MTKTITLALAAIALSTGTAALAGESEQKSTAISYADLDLTTEDGAAELDRRIHRAAETACNVNESTVGTRITSREARKCYTQARKQLDKHFAQVKRDAKLGG